MLDLAIHIVDTRRGKFEPRKFEDHYENALKELLRKKQKGEKIERPREAAPTNVVNLMEALRQSVKAEGGKHSSATRAQSKKAKKRIAGQREMLLPIPGKKDKETAKSTASPPSENPKRVRAWGSVASLRLLRLSGQGVGGWGWPPSQNPSGTTIRPPLANSIGHWFRPVSLRRNPPRRWANRHTPAFVRCCRSPQKR
jgi:hypothetical protein